MDNSNQFPGGLSNKTANTMKETSASVWARYATELFEAYVKFQQRAGNPDLSSPELRAVCAQQQRARAAFPQPMMSYYSYYYAAAPHIPMPPLSPTGVEKDPDSNSGPRLAARIEEVLSEVITSRRQCQVNVNGSSPSSSDSDGQLCEPEVIQARNHFPNGVLIGNGNHSPQLASSSTFPTNEVADADTLHGFANYIADYSTKHGITTGELMAQMIYAHSLYDAKQELIKGVAESLGSVSIHNEVLQDLKPELQFSGLELPDFGAQRETDEIPDKNNDNESEVSEDKPASGSSLETEGAAHTQEDFKINDPGTTVEQVADTPNGQMVVVPQSGPGQVFRTSIGTGYRTGTYYMPPDQMSYASMHMPVTFTPPPYWSQQLPMYDNFANYGYFSAPPATLMRYPAMASGLAGYAPGTSSAPEFGFGPPMHVTPQFIPHGMAMVDSNKKGICPFCRRNGENESVYRSHNLYQPGTRRVICPVLRRFKCEICGASGDYAHTKGYCRLNDGTNGHGNGSSNQNSPPPASASKPPPAHQ